MSEAQNDTEKKAKKGKSKLLTLGVPVLVLAGAGAGGWWYFSKPASAAEAPKEEAPAEPAAHAGLVPLDPFVVNLADPSGRKYLRVTMVLLVADEHTATEVEENKLTLSLIRSSIIELLTTHSSADLSTPEGRSNLKKAVAETAKQAGHLDVHDVLFEEFIVQ